MNSLKTLRLLAGVLLGIVLLVSCSKQEPTLTSLPTKPDREPTSAPTAVERTPTTYPDDAPLLILVADPLSTLEPYRMVDLHPDGSVASHLWDTLTLLNDDLEIEPHVAESWRLVNNFTWEFTLHQGIVFHNGEPLNAQAVKASIERAQSMPGSLETFAQDISLEEVEVVSDYVLRIKTSFPVSNLPYHLASLELVPPVYYAETDPSQLADAPVGSGPYQVKRWVPGKEVVLEAVPSYWKGTPSRPRLVFRTVPRIEDRLAALGSQESVLVTDLTPAQAVQWNLPNAEVEAVVSARRMFVGMCITEGSPLEDKRVRQALNYGLDAQEIIDNQLEGYGERYGSWVNPPSGNPDLSPWPYNSVRARSLLAQAGYPDGFATTLYAPLGVYPRGADIAHAIAEQLGRIGVAVKVEEVDWLTYVGRLLSDSPPPLFLLAMNSRGDGLEDVRNLSADFALNPTGWRNEQFEQDLRRAASSFNVLSRSRSLNEAQAIAYEESPWIWLWRQYDFYGINPSLDWTPRADGLVNVYEPQ